MKGTRENRIIWYWFHPLFYYGNVKKNQFTNCLEAILFNARKEILKIITPYDFNFEGIRKEILKITISILKEFSYRFKMK